MTELTWTCHVCGEERPDRLVGVYTSRETLPSGVELAVNIRYCVDRSGCGKGAVLEARQWLRRILEAGTRNA